MKEGMSGEGKKRGRQRSLPANNGRVVSSGKERSTKFETKQRGSRPIKTLYNTHCQWPFECHW
jgi:hypothetical protein